MSSQTTYQKLKRLPVSTDLLETIPVLKKLATASAALAELKGISKTIPNEYILINALVLKEAKDSSEIENIITSQDDLYKAVTLTKNNFNSQTKEVVRYRMAMMKVYNTIKNQQFIRVKDIIDVQELLLDNNAGIRKVPGTTLKNAKTGKVVFVPPQDHQEINDLLSNFIQHFNDKDVQVHPLILMAVFHFQFESIHPFYDGNGRTGRIINVIYLIMNDLIETPLLYLSSYIIKHKKSYYEFLNEVNTTYQWENWLCFILEAIETTSNNSVFLIKEIKNLLDDTIIITQEKAPKIYRKELVEILFEHPYIKIENLVDRLHIERRTASRYLKELEEINILRSEKIGREIIFINIKLMELLKS